MKAKKRTLTNSIIKIFLIAFTVIILLGIIKNVKASAKPDKVGQLTCTSVCIDHNDTLWSIAEEYYTEDYDSMEQYIEVIRKTNKLGSDKIYAGCYLIIPYYTYN